MSFDVVTHSEVRRLAQSLDKGMGLQLRSRSVWESNDQLQQEVRLGGDSPYRLAPKSNPDYAFESICHNGEIYAATQVSGTNTNYVYTSPDLKTWTYRYSYSISGLITVGKAIWCTQISSPHNIISSLNNGINWAAVSGGSGYFYPLCSAGKYGYAFSTSTSSSIFLLTEAGQRESITLPEAGIWRFALHNGSQYVILSHYCDRAFVSSDGRTNWKPAVDLTAMLTEMPSHYGATGPRIPFEINGRLIIFDSSSGGISSIISDNGVNWRIGARGTCFGSDNFISDIGKFAGVYKGALYVAVRLSSSIPTDIGRMALLETRDGIRFRLLPSFPTGRSSAAEAPPGVYAKVDGSGIIFNSNANSLGPRYESAPQAMELYCAL